MKTYRIRMLLSLGVLACAAGLSLAACSSGAGSISAASTSSMPNTSGPSATLAGVTTTVTAPSLTSIASSSASTTAGSSIVDTFPVPPGANVVQKSSSVGAYHFALSGVTAKVISDFYKTALPQAGYVITENGSWTGGPYTAVSIAFTGHGYEGHIGAWTGDHTDGNGLIGVSLVPQ
ncbi:hypothetical protein [Catenulispora rubra]|uniref:hypothetical protein n=1 Tax=Catenulispora rubra TaxID=280293 RepID=UPI0018923E67|nr:hypothetical protein [Catenulispora rubra]